MPELPDVVVYLDALTRRYGGRVIERIDVRSPFVVRTVEPDLIDAAGKRLLRFSRIGKRIVWHLEADLAIVFHLMIAGRFHERAAGTRPTGKRDLAAFHFEHQTLMFTEASKKRRASIHCVRGNDALQHLDPGGLEPLDCSFEDFKLRMQLENRTLKRALTDPRKFSGIGNAYSDEILHAAGLSPLARSRQLDDDQFTRLWEATRAVLGEWVDRLIADCADGFPEKVTAFRPQMAVHGRYGEPCPVCETTVQRIVYAENESNYCPRCQTGGKMLADRSLSRLLKDDWPRTIEAWEEGV